ncbi:MAG: tetratricopeptide repeat protein, partial [Sediminibacterium sp.]
MKFYNLIIKYRFWLSLVLVGVGVILNLTGTGFWPTFPIYFVALIGLLSHFFIGPLRLIQEPME